MRDFGIFMLFCFFAVRACSQEQIAPANNSRAQSTVRNDSADTGAIHASNDTLPPQRPAQPAEATEALETLCAQSLDECVDSISERVVQVHTTNVLGTGLILFSDEQNMTILTAAHVIVAKTAGFWGPTADLFVKDDSVNQSVRATVACAFDENKIGDLALLTVPNFTKKIFAAPNYATDGYVGERYLIVEHRSERKRGWVFTVNSFDRPTRTITLQGSNQQGMSGSAFFTLDGRIGGVLTHVYIDFDGTIGTYNIDRLLDLDVSALAENERRDDPFACRRY